MWIERLWVEQFRCLEAAELLPCSGLNWIGGRNGAGKTSVLEAIAVLASGRSFRTHRPETLVRESGVLRVVATLRGLCGVSTLGVERSGAKWTLRAAGQSLRSFTECAPLLAVEVFEPDSHEIVSGGSESRRRFLDWGVFHVEPSFGPAWSRYQRALRQRNAVLRSGGADAGSLRPWNAELVESGELLTHARLQFLDRFVPAVGLELAQLAGELGAPELRFRRGWAADSTLADVLLGSFERDRLLGHTSRGPHRADWSLHLSKVGDAARWSRGQQKIAVFALCRAMLAVFESQRGEPAVACLDDVFSELDAEHQERCLQSLAKSGAQVWMTGTEMPGALRSWHGAAKAFHVEQGRITEAPGL